MTKITMFGMMESLSLLFIHPATIIVQLKHSAEMADRTGNVFNSVGNIKPTAPKTSNKPTTLICLSSMYFNPFIPLSSSLSLGRNILFIPVKVNTNVITPFRTHIIVIICPSLLVKIALISIRICSIIIYFFDLLLLTCNYYA